MISSMKLNPSKKRSRASGPRGFTLVELLLVLVILGILLISIVERTFTRNSSKSCNCLHKFKKFVNYKQA